MEFANAYRHGSPVRKLTYAYRYISLPEHNFVSFVKKLKSCFGSPSKMRKMRRMRRQPCVLNPIDSTELLFPALSPHRTGGGGAQERKLHKRSLPRPPAVPCLPPVVVGTTHTNPCGRRRISGIMGSSDGVRVSWPAKKCFLVLYSP